MDRAVRSDNIILIGFMGSGKSAVGTALAKRLKRKFVDTDQLVEEMAGIAIREIFACHGEARFRDLESQAAAALLSYKPGELVAATGGGIVLRRKNRLILHRAGKVVLLTASLPDLILRTSGGTERPLLNDSNRLEQVRKMLKQREPYYSENNLTINTSGKSIEEVCAEIIETLQL